MTPQEIAETEDFLSGFLGDGSSWSLYGREHRTPMTFVLDEAERTLKSAVNLYWVDSYSPEIFCLKNRPEPVIVFSTRFLEIWADLRRIITDDTLDASLKKAVLTEHLLRLIAEYSLSMDDPEFAAVVSIEAAKQTRGGILFIPNTLQSLDYEPISIRYMCAWFFALCHELGHFTEENTSTTLRVQVSDLEIIELVGKRLADLKLPSAQAFKAAQQVKDNPDRFILGVNRIKSEFNSDFFATVLLFVCTQKILNETGNGEDFSWAEYLSELTVSLNVITLIDRCRRIALFSCTAEPSNSVALEMILQPTAMSVRLSLLYNRFLPMLSNVLYGPKPSEKEAQQFNQIVRKTIEANNGDGEIVDQSLVDAYKITLDRTNRAGFVETLDEYRKTLLENPSRVNNVPIQMLLERALNLKRWSPIFTSLKNVIEDPARSAEYSFGEGNLIYLCVGIRGPHGSSQIFGLPTRYGHTVFIFTDDALCEKFLELSKTDLPEDLSLEKIVLVVGSAKRLRYAVLTRLAVGTNAHLVVQGTKDFTRYMRELSSGEIFDTDP